jgi:hypothetical protein
MSPLAPRPMSSYRTSSSDGRRRAVHLWRRLQVLELPDSQAGAGTSQGRGGGPARPAEGRGGDRQDGAPGEAALLAAAWPRKRVTGLASISFGFPSRGPLGHVLDGVGLSCETVPVSPTPAGGSWRHEQQLATWFAPERTITAPTAILGRHLPCVWAQPPRHTETSRSPPASAPGTLPPIWGATRRDLT